MATTPAPAFAAAPPPADDYGLVAWCHGMVGGYLELRDRLMPEVRRIEAAFPTPGSSLAEDLRAYDELAEAGRRSRMRFAAALESAEAAGLASAAERIAAARQGRTAWPDITAVGARRLAQEWMAWTLPARCEAAADRLSEASLAKAPLAGRAAAAGDALAGLETRCREGRPGSCRLLARERLRQSP